MKFANYLAEAFPIIEPPTITLLKKGEEIKYKNLIKIKLCHNPINATSETYEFNMGTFKSSSPEEVIQLLNNFNKAVVLMIITSPVGKSTSYVPYSK